MSDRLDEFSKFVRFFTVRLTQTLVQARLGSKIENSCSVDSDQTCWFNVKVDELGEIAAYLRNAIKNYPPTCPSVTIEFFLYTADGVFLPLEAWKLSVDDDIDALVNVRTDLYHQLGTLLRSAAVAARMTPMYRYYVKKQSHDTFVILYRIYEGEPSADLGDESKHNRIGYLPSPYGSICLDLTFRTQMEIPNREILVVDPVPDINKLAVTNQNTLPCRPSFSDAIPVSGGPSELPAPMGNTMCVFATSPTHSPSPVGARFRLGRSTSSEDSILHSEDHHSSVEKCKEPVFASGFPKLRNNSFPFATLLSSSYGSQQKRSSVSSANDILFEESESPQRENIDNEDKGKKRNNEEGISKLSKEASINGEEDMMSSDDSYVKICAFAPSKCIGNEIGHFITEFRMAPQSMFNSSPCTVEELQNQIVELNAQKKDFDEFIRQIHELGKEEE